MGTRDSDAIIIGVLDDNGNLSSVRRYRAREADRCERDILELTRVGRTLKVTFIERHDGAELKDDAVRERITDAVEVTQ